MGSLTKRVTALAALVLTAGLLSPTSTATAADEPTPAADYCKGQCADILPPGANGSATLAQILGNKLLGTLPPHADDQLGPYDALSSGYPSLTDDTLTNFFNDSSFGVKDDQVGSVTRPREDVTITRDKKNGVPHIKGSSRYGTEFGAASPQVRTASG